MPVLQPPQPMNAGNAQVSMEKNRMVRDASLRLIPNESVASMPVGILRLGQCWNLYK